MSSARALEVASGQTVDAPALQQQAASVRALFLLNSLNVGGSETKTVRVANALSRQGVHAGVAYLNEPDTLLSAFDPDIPVWHLHRRGKFSLAALRSLRCLIREQRPDVVIAMSLYPTLYALSATRRLPHRPRTIAMINTTDFRKGREWEPAFYRSVLRRFDSVIYGCEVQRTGWRALLGSAYSRSAVIYNGVDTQHFMPDTDAAAIAGHRARFAIPPRAFVLGSVGRLAPEKNHALLLDVLEELRRRSLNAHLLLVGEGPLRAQLVRLIDERHLQAHVTLAGMLADVRPALNAMDVFVLPSTRVETFSNAALEAMAMARPVILSRIGGATEMVSEAGEGFTIDCTRLHSDLPPLLAELCRDVELRERLGRAARARVLRDFSLCTMVARYRALIDGPVTGEGAA